MTRYVWPHALLLHCAELLAAHELGLTNKAANKVLPKPDGNFGPAVALRWSSNPALGFPRAPFSVYRRVPSWKPDRTIIAKPVKLGTGKTIPLGGDELFEIRFGITPSGTVVVEALDAHGRPIPGQRVVFVAAGIGAMRCPGIAALRITGGGTLTGFTGMTAAGVANGGGWQRIAVVGLPYDYKEVPDPVYAAATLQGYEPPSQSGLDAAITRLTAERGLSLPIPATSIPTIPTPAWPLLDPVALVKQVRDAGMLEMITKCLDNSNDADPGKQQVTFKYDHTLDGVRQVDQPLPPGAEPATVGVPVVGVTQLAVGSDGEAAAALGYGVIDFPVLFGKEQDGLIWPPEHTPPPYLYMVEAVYTLPFVGQLLIAALSQVRPPPGPATALTADTTLGNRAPAPDAPETAAVALGWRLASPPVAYVVAVSRTPGSSEVLNAKRVAAPGHDLFVPQRPVGPDGSPAADARTRFVDQSAPVPFDGVASSTYLVLARDVFTRWATWSKIDHAIAAPAVAAPGLQSAALAATGVPVGAQVPGTLTLEVAWDWSDRSPAKIELTGRFYAGTTPPASYLAGLERDAVGSGDPKVVLTFDAARDPVVPVGAPWQAHRISPPGDDRCVYRVRVLDMVCDFGGASELRYAAYARGYELVRPGTASAVVGPRTAFAADPRPAPPPALPQILWTALPDATNTARALLTWAASSGGAPATGYFVWEASETALRAAVGLPPIAAPAPGVVSKTLPERAGELRDHINADPTREQQSLVAFTRLDERAIAVNHRELALPGAADTLHVYRISTITAAGVESGRGTGLAFVGVPRRAVPGAPQLLLRRAEGAVRVYAIQGGGQAPAGYAVHRVRNPRAVAEVGLMGPPVHAATSGLWTGASASDPALRGVTDLTPYRVLEDPVPASWDDLYYRLVAVGQHDPANGVYRGRSRASALQSIVRPPAAGPLLDSVTYTPDAGSRVIGFRTDLPVRTCSLGQAKIEVAELATAGAAVVRTPLFTTTTELVAVGPAFAVIPAPTPIQLQMMPQISRGLPDAQGRVVYSVRLVGGAGIRTLRVTDPLGRTAELTLPEVP